jgi:hypothetical protein
MAYRHSSKSTAWKRQGISKSAWLSAFERHVLAAKPEMAGKIDWDTATYLYNQRYTAGDAANKVTGLTPEPDATDMAYEDQCRDMCGL